MEQRKACSRCRQTKELSDFARDDRKRFGRASACRKCMVELSAAWAARNPERVRASQAAYCARHPDRVQRTRRNSKMRIRYGITLEQYEEMLGNQGGHCAICPATEPGRGGRRYLYVDHCHKTGKVRGPLCGNCNDGVGRFRDSPELLHSAIAYLSSYDGDD